MVTVMKHEHFMHDESANQRREFEEFISKPPFEKNISRHPETEDYAWPGAYKDSAVDLAFQAWMESRSKQLKGNDNLIKSVDIGLLKENYAFAQEHILMLAKQITSMRARGHRLLVQPINNEVEVLINNIIAELTIGEITCKNCGKSEETINLSQLNEIENLRKLIVSRNELEIYEESFQDRVKPWLDQCFGSVIAADRNERNHRLLEESLELVQACGCTITEAHQLVDYVYSRPKGEPTQEVGGVMLTLAALCLANNLNMHECAEIELSRVWIKIDAIREKQKRKPEMSPLPSVDKENISAVRNFIYQSIDIDIYTTEAMIKGKCLSNEKLKHNLIEYFIEIQTTKINTALISEILSEESYNNLCQVIRDAAEKLNRVGK